MWHLEPASPYYDEFADIHTGQWWITTPNGLVGCSSEDDARAILAVFGQGLVERQGSSAAAIPGMLYHADGTPYMHVADYFGGEQ